MSMDDDAVKKPGAKNGSDRDVDIYDDADDFMEEDLGGGDQEWESYDEEDGDLDDPAPKRKKGLFSFNTIVITIAVVFGGAFIAMQLSKQAPKQQPTAQQQQVSQTGLPMLGQKEREEFNRIDDPALTQVSGLPPEKAENQEEGTARQGAELPLPPEEGATPVVPEGLPSPGVMGEEKNTGSSQTESSQKTGIAAPVPAKMADTASSDVLTPMPSGLPDAGIDLPPEKAVKGKQAEQKPESGMDALPPMPKADAIFKSGSTTPQMPAAPVKTVETHALPTEALPDAATAAMPAPSEKAPGLDAGAGKEGSSAEISSLTTQLSDLSQRLTRLEDKMTKTAQASETLSSGGSEEEIAALKKTVERLESKISTMSSASARAETAQDRAPIKAEVKISSEERASESAPVKKKSVRKESAKPKPSSIAAKSASAPVREVSTLEIRSAQPGKAWVARPGDNDLQSVSVGDSLPGLGRVTSIAQVGGRWVVEGTRGRLTQ